MTIHLNTKNDKLHTHSKEHWRLSEYKTNYVQSNIIKNKKLYDNISSKPIEHWKYSGVNRFHSAITLAYRLLPDTTDTITVLYKIKDVQQTDKEVIYTMGYIGTKQEKNTILYLDLLERLHNIKLNVSDNIYVDSIAVSGSMTSKDGEYRAELLNWNAVQVILKKDKEIHQLYNFIVEYFSNVLKERKYILVTKYYYPTDKFKNKYQYETELLCESNKIHFFVLLWFNFYYAYYFNIISNHINENFKKLLLKYKKEDVEFFKLIWKKFSLNAIETFRYMCGNYIKGATHDLKIYNKSKIGQKIIPLNLIEAQKFFNIEYTPWKEYFINSKVSDLVLNNVSNGFSLGNNWLIIKNQDKDLYDNPSQADRLDKCSAALKIAEILNQARLYTYSNINIDDEEKNDEKIIDRLLYNFSDDRIDITTWLSNEFKNLYKMIQDGINFSKENIIMSNISLCLISEYVGKTLYDSIFLTHQSAFYKKLVPSIFVVENFGYFKKYMFQMCYNLYCLNSKLNIIHGDLHLNNITMNSMFYKKNISVSVKDPKVVYILDDSHQYIFDTNFYDICLIDFSRAIMHPDSYEMFKLDHIPYDIVNSKASFLNKQVKDLLGYLYATKPEFKEFGTSIEPVMLHNYKEYFKVLSALDIYNLSLKFVDFLKSDNKYVKNPYMQSIKLISDINKSAEYYLTTVLNKLITERNFDEINAMEWPILTIIKDLFSDNLADNFEKDYDSIVDVYNFSNESKYSLSSFKHFPPVLRESREIVNNKISVITPTLHKITRGFSINHRKAYENKSIKNYQTVNIIQIRQLEKNL
jgi:hypothetical protein